MFFLSTATSTCLLSLVKSPRPVLRDRARATEANHRARQGPPRLRRSTVYANFQQVLPTLTIRVTAQYESTLIKLTNAEVQVEDLKLQLDDALGAEEMLVQLTERNLMLGEVSSLLSLTEMKGKVLTICPAENRGDAHHDRGPRGAQRAQR